MIILKQEKKNQEHKDSSKDFNQFKKDWKNEDKIYITKLFNFLKFKDKKGIELGLDFRNLSEFELPVIWDLKKVKYLYIDKNVENKEFYIERKIKLIYSFENFSIQNKENVQKEIENLVKRKGNFSDIKYNKILSNIFLEIPVEDNDEEELFKIITFVKKILLKYLSEVEVKKIKILLKNNFSNKKNELILKNKLLKINGVII